MSRKHDGSVGYIHPRRAEAVDNVTNELPRTTILDEFDGGSVPTWKISQERIESERREQVRWGSATGDVRFLRTRDFIIRKSGVGDAYCVCDERLITVAELRKKASRERRLMGLEPYVADPIPYDAPIYRDVQEAA